MSSMTSLKTIEVLRTLFALYGIPEEMVSDNWPKLASEKFTQFLKKSVFRSSQVPLYHRASNGAAGRSVQTAKAVLTKQVLNGKANTLILKHRLVANFLILNSSTSQIVTGKSVTELFLKWQIRS